MAKVKKQPKPKALPPKGFRDYFGAEVTDRAHMLEQIAGVYHLDTEDFAPTAGISFAF